MMNQQPPMQGIANQMAQHGRYGDSMLVHMNPVEVQGIAALSPTGSLTTNPVTGQPEAFLPFLAPLLGSFLGSSFLTGAALPGILGGGALSSAAAGAIGSGLATTAATGDLKKGLISGLTGYGVGQALGAAGDALRPEVANIEGALQGTGDAVGAIDSASLAGVDVASAGADLVDPLAQATQAGIDPLTGLPINEAFSPVATNPLTSTLPGGSAQIPMSPALTPAQQAVAGPMDKFTAAQTAKTAADAKVNRLTDMLRAERASLTPMERAAAPFSNPGTFGKALIQPTNLAPIALGEGKRGEMEMQERFARDARFAEEEAEETLRRAERNLAAGFAAGGITNVNPNNYMDNVRGLYALAGGGRTVQNFRRGGEAENENEFSSNPAIFGPGPAANRQKKLHGTLISPEQLQGYRPGFDAEINYFPTATTPAPSPGNPPVIIPGGPPGNPPGGPGRGGPAMGGGLGGFDYREFLDSDEGREAMGQVRGALGIPDFSTIDTRLEAIEGRPTPTMPAIDYDEITNRVRGGINIPEFDLSGIDSRLASIENRQMPSIDYDAITSRVREGIDIPEYTPPQIDYDLITNRVREGIDIPSFDTSNIMDAISANRDAISSMPSSPSVDYDEIANRVRGSIDIPSVDLSGIENRLGAIEGREMPTLDTSGIMSAIDANRQAISGLPAPSPAFDPSGIMAAIEANRKAIGGINSGGINPDPMAGLPTRTMSNPKVTAPPKLGPRRFAEGGETDMPADQGSRIIDLTIAAVMGQLPEDQAEAVVNRFVDEFGSEAFAILRRQVLQGNVPGAQTEGKINGNGGGMDDKVPGMIGDQQPVAVSPGEFIVPADVVSGLGDGSTDAGVEELHGMMDKVRKERTGMRQQPRPVDKAKVMPV